MKLVIKSPFETPLVFPALYKLVDPHGGTHSPIIVLFLSETKGVVVDPLDNKNYAKGEWADDWSRCSGPNWERLPPGSALIQE